MECGRGDDEDNLMLCDGMQSCFLQTCLLSPKSQSSPNYMASFVAEHCTPFPHMVLLWQGEIGSASHALQDPAQQLMHVNVHVHVIASRRMTNSSAIMSILHAAIGKLSGVHSRLYQDTAVFTS